MLQLIATLALAARAALPAEDSAQVRREELMAKLKSGGYTVLLRHARTDCLSKVKKLEKISEDDKTRAEKDIQKLTDEHIKQIDGLIVSKEAEIMEV